MVTHPTTIDLGLERVREKMRFWSAMGFDHGSFVMDLEKMIGHGFSIMRWIGHERRERKRELEFEIREERKD